VVSSKYHVFVLTSTVRSSSFVITLSGKNSPFDHLSRSYAHATVIVCCRSSDLFATSGNSQSATVDFSSSLLINQYLAKNGVDVALVIIASPAYSATVLLAVKSLSLRYTNQSGRAEAAQDLSSVSHVFACMTAAGSIGANATGTLAHHHLPYKNHNIANAIIAVRIANRSVLLCFI